MGDGGGVCVCVGGGGACVDAGEEEAQSKTCDAALLN